jgi:hypothetical protein
MIIGPWLSVPKGRWPKNKRKRAERKLLLEKATQIKRSNERRSPPHPHTPRIFPRCPPPGVLAASNGAVILATGMFSQLRCFEP